jgi:hypothetical protein
MYTTSRLARASAAGPGSRTTGTFFAAAGVRARAFVAAFFAIGGASSCVFCLADRRGKSA